MTPIIKQGVQISGYATVIVAVAVASVVLDFLQLVE